MTATRLPWYIAAIVLVLLLGYGLAVCGLALCSPPPLPGEAAWVWTNRLHEAIAVIAGHQTRCFLLAASGRAFIALASWSGQAALAVAVVALLWETAGLRARRQIRRWRGRHAILAGEPGEIETLAATVGKASTVFVARQRSGALAIGRAHPLAEVAILGDRRDAARQMGELGASRANFIAATTANDLVNGALAEAALDEGGAGNVLVRLENASVRALKSDGLRRMAEGKKRSLAVISLRQMQARQALHSAMPGRFRGNAPARVHIALCGAGPMMQEAAFLIARQGYGLEDTPPLLSVMRTGRSDFGAGALERLIAAEAVEVHPIIADGDDAIAIDRAFATIALAESPLCAVHCCEEQDGAALALALRLERIFVDMEIPVPPIIVHGDGPEASGDTGMVRGAPPLSLSEARARTALIDQRAIVFHAAYLEGQRQARGAAFGGLPAECEWSVLPERFRDDNRYAADHIDYKLARTGFIPAMREIGASFSRADIKLLASLEHARWMASRSIAGWHHGEIRDDKLLLHPDMKPYDKLDEDAKRKDREQVSLIPVQLSRGGESLARLHGYGLLSAKGAQRAIALLKSASERKPAAQPLVAIALETVDGIEIAEAALAAGLPVEAFVAVAVEHTFPDRRLCRRAAAMLRQAWRIQIVPRLAAGQTVAAKYPILVDAEGRVHEAVLP